MPKQTKPYCPTNGCGGRPNGACTAFPISACFNCKNSQLNNFNRYCPNCYHCLNCNRIIKRKYNLSDL